MSLTLCGIGEPIRFSENKFVLREKNTQHKFQTTNKCNSFCVDAESLQITNYIIRYVKKKNIFVILHFY